MRFLGPHLTTSIAATVVGMWVLMELRGDSKVVEGRTRAETEE